MCGIAGVVGVIDVDQKEFENSLVKGKKISKAHSKTHAKTHATSNSK